MDLRSFVATTGNDESGDLTGDLTSQNQRFEGFTSELLLMIQVGLLGKKSGFL